MPLLVILVFNSCKRNENFFVKTEIESREEKFFKSKKPLSKETEKLIEELKLVNSRNQFVNGLNDKQGLPLWDKIEVVRKKYNNYLSRELSDSSDSTDVVIIPLTITESALSSILICKEISEGTFDLKNYTSNDYLYKKAQETSSDLEKMTELFTLFFYMENKSFDKTVFYNIPARYFSNSTLLDYKGDKIVKIKSIDYTTANTTTVCINYVCSKCEGNDPDCPLGGSWTTCTTIHDGGLPSSGGWDPGNVTSGDPFGGGGGGGTNPPPTLPPCPGTIWYELWRVEEAGSGSSSPNCAPVINPCGLGGVTLPDGTCVNSSNYPGKELGMPYLWWTNTEWIQNNFSFDIDNNVPNAPKITWAEVLLTAAHPVEALAIKLNAATAKSETVNRYVREGWNDKSDAFKHTCWMALNSKYVGIGLALQFGTAHESEVPAERQIEVTMDIHNNSIGAALYQSDMSDADLIQNAYNAVTGGLCLYLDPLNTDGSIKPNETVILHTNQ